MCWTAEFQLNCNQSKEIHYINRSKNIVKKHKNQPKSVEKNVKETGKNCLRNGWDLCICEQNEQK